MHPTDPRALNADVEISVPVETVCYIIQRAHDLQGKTASSLYDDETAAEDDDPKADILEDRQSDAVAQELDSVISDLSVDAQIDLVALMWLGREEDDWTRLRALAEQEHNDATVDYLCGTPLLGDYLAAGLNALGRDCRDWDLENL